MSARPLSSCAAAIADCFPEGWRPYKDHYAYSVHPSSETFLLPLAKIEPPGKEFGALKFDMDRLFELARRIANHVPLPPIGVDAPAISRKYLLRVSAGCHRFYLCQELGFTQIAGYFAGDALASPMLANPAQSGSLPA